MKSLLILFLIFNFLLAQLNPGDDYLGVIIFRNSQNNADTQNFPLCRCAEGEICRAEWSPSTQFGTGAERCILPGRFFGTNRVMQYHPIDNINRIYAQSNCPFGNRCDLTSREACIDVPFVLTDGLPCSTYNLAVNEGCYGTDRVFLCLAAPVRGPRWILSEFNSVAPNAVTDCGPVGSPCAQVGQFCNRARFEDPSTTRILMCIDIDPPECTPNCQNGGLCVADNQCDCPVGFTGDFCECQGIIDDCGVCNGNNNDQDLCGDCFGMNQRRDQCGVCGGNNRDLDECGVCLGDGSSCIGLPRFLNASFAISEASSTFIDFDNVFAVDEDNSPVEQYQVVRALNLQVLVNNNPVSEFLHSTLGERRVQVVHMGEEAPELTLTALADGRVSLLRSIGILFSSFNDSPIVIGSIPLRTVAVRTIDSIDNLDRFFFDPDNSFSDLALILESLDSPSLQNWIRISPDQLQISINSPPEEGVFQFRLYAFDPFRRSAFTDFTIEVNSGVLPMDPPEESEQLELYLGIAASITSLICFCFAVIVCIVGIYKKKTPTSTDF